MKSCGLDRLLNAVKALIAVNGSHRTRAMVVWLLAALSLSAWAQMSPLPTASIRNVPETFFGTVVQDPYRDFENAKSPAVAAWMKAHGDAARATLARISGRETMRARLAQYDSATPAHVVDVQRTRGELFFFQRRGANDNPFKLYMKRGLTGAETLLFDPDLLRKKTGQPHAMDYFAASPDGSKVAIGVSAGGSEEARLRVLDTRSGRQLGPEISRADYGGVSWAPDGRELFFIRLQAMKPGMAQVERFQRSTVVALTPGDGETRLRTVLQAGRDLDMPPTQSPALSVSPDGRVLALTFDGVRNEFAAWHSTLAALRAGKPAWQKLFDFDDQISAVALQGDQLFALSSKGAPRYQVISGKLDGFTAATARVVVAQGANVITGMAAALDALYLETRQGNIKRLLRLPYADGAQATDVPLPVSGAMRLAASARADLPGVLIDLQSWIRARQIYGVNADGRVVNTGLQPSGPFDAPGNLVATEVLVRSHDGVRVPLSIIHKDGIQLDGNNPTLLYGYAAYGITEEPVFSSSRLAWLDAGGVYAVANPRGSGVFGRAWHEAGKEATKPNTWLDFIACAEYLIAQQWTQSSKLGIWGGSAGGILVGRAMTERPDLFAAVVSEVGALDMVRAETTPNGVPNIPEFGSRTTRPGFEALLAMSSYHQVKDGVVYPAVLLTHGVNDPRVEVWNSTKMAARLKAVAAGLGDKGRPVLLRLDYAGGHGIGATKAQQLDERADIFSFLLWQMGVAGYGLRP